ncbi:RNA ligase family protein [Natronomonas marina]|uniref:RNA ligase family protein n=1 Tax=Natronomonas marina TaxID=2961939 RepID=UPI0020C99E94|nr:RNA ligase family protein [Natronomonas marina]
MKTYPPVPHVEDAPAGLLESGHLWIQELIDGGQLRFRLRDSGVVEFGDSLRLFGEEVPPRYRHAVRHVRETLDREALSAAVDDVESVVFVGESTHRRAVDYEFDRMPPVLGLDVFDHDREAFLPPDATERVFDRLGLATVNTFEREVRASDFDATPEAIPESAWYDGPAAGIVVRNKTGDVTKLPNPAVDLDVDPDSLAGDAETLAERYVTDGLLRRVAAEMPAGREPTFEAVFERACETVFREAHGRLSHHETDVELGEFRSAVGRRVREWLDARA